MATVRHSGKSTSGLNGRPRLPRSPSQACFLPYVCFTPCPQIRPRRTVDGARSHVSFLLWTCPVNGTPPSPVAPVSPTSHIRWRTTMPLFLRPRHRQQAPVTRKHNNKFWRIRDFLFKSLYTILLTNEIIHIQHAFISTSASDFTYNFEKENENHHGNLLGIVSQHRRQKMREEHRTETARQTVQPNSFFALILLWTCNGVSLGRKERGRGGREAASGTFSNSSFACWVFWWTSSTL